MTSPELKRLWDKVVTELRGALNGLSALNSNAQLDSAKDLLKHNELGFSCEAIEDAIEDQDLKSDVEIEAYLNEARRLMEMPVILENRHDGA